MVDSTNLSLGIYFFNFTPYSVYSRVGGEPGNLVQRHSAAIKTLLFSAFRRTIKALRVEWRKSMPRFASSYKK